VADEPEKFNIEKAWSEHRELHTSRIPGLHLDAVDELASWLSRGHIPRELVDIDAENIPCEYPGIPSHTTDAPARFALPGGTVTKPITNPPRKASSPW